VPNLLLTTMSRVIQQSKLVVVLDLDETLLLASTTETLSERLELVQKQK
jgi:predicted secreted acid phosphatase